MVRVRIMKYIALLRGINISGKNKIPMSELKKDFEELGYTNVVTYLNSGNVVFETSIDNRKELAQSINEKIKNVYDLDIPIYITTENELKEILENSPDWWETESKEIYDNIIFIIPPCDVEQVAKSLGAPNEKLERVQRYKNSIFWSYNLKEYRKTNWWSKTATVDIRNAITIRTANTMKKVLDICNK